MLVRRDGEVESQMPAVTVKCQRHTTWSMLTYPQQYIRLCPEPMPHSPEDKKKAITRLKRIKGQAEALERAIAVGTDCSLLLQQISALRGAAGGLMAEVLESHLRESFGQNGIGVLPALEKLDDIDEIVKILRTYLK